MKASIESTDQILEFSVQDAGGVPGPVGKGRLWVGTTERGVPVQMLVVRVAVPTGVMTREHTETFERELQETPAPIPEIVAFPLRMIL